MITILLSLTLIWLSLNLSSSCLSQSIKKQPVTFLCTFKKPLCVSLSRLREQLRYDIQDSYLYMFMCACDFVCVCWLKSIIWSVFWKVRLLATSEVWKINWYQTTGWLIFCYSIFLITRKKLDLLFKENLLKCIKLNENYDNF